MEDRVLRNDKGEIISVSGNIFCFQGKAYTIGTVVEDRRFYHSEIKTYIGRVNGGEHGWKNEEGEIEIYYPCTIVRIIKPVEFVEPPKIYVKRTFWDFISSKPHPAHTEEVFYAWILYIVVMLVGAIFKDRVSIWIVASMWFFGWKYKQ